DRPRLGCRLLHTRPRLVRRFLLEHLSTCLEQGSMQQLVTVGSIFGVSTTDLCSFPRLPVSLPTPQEFRETVRSQTDLVSLIGESISLQPRHGGRHFVGLCPFHEDHNPSLNVYPDRQTFRCWSC